MKFKPYPYYKDSGVQWITEIPKDWDVYKLKFLLSTLQSGKRESDETAPLDDGAFSIGGEHITWEGTLKLDNVRLLSYEFYNAMNNGKVKPNDVLLVKDGATIGKTALVTNMPYEKMALNEHVFLMRPNDKINAKLLYYLICSDSGFSQIKLTETGSAQGGINSSFVNDVFFSVPKNLQEIKKIVDFLDYKNSQIQRIIDKEKILVDLLKEKRSALINNIILNGFNTDGKRKNTDIEWIESLPSNWKVDKLKRFCKKITDGSHNSPETIDEGKYYITVTDVKEEKIDFENAHFISEEDFENLRLNGCQPRTGDLLLSKDGTIGRCIIVKNNDFVVLSSLAIITPTKFLKPEYLRYYFISDLNVDQMLSRIRGSALTRLTISIIKELIIIVPPVEEQNQIIEFLNKETTNITNIINNVNENISLLEEYKKSIIHHVLTGKVDVREVVI
jgi:type I restriction enzyme, S subunit